MVQLSFDTENFEKKDKHNITAIPNKIFCDKDDVVISANNHSFANIHPKKHLNQSIAMGNEHKIFEKDLDITIPHDEESKFADSSFLGGNYFSPKVKNFQELGNQSPNKITAVNNVNSINRVFEYQSFKPDNLIEIEDSDSYKKVEKKIELINDKLGKKKEEMSKLSKYNEDITKVGESKKIVKK